MEKEKAEIIFRIAKKFTQIEDTPKAFVSGYITRAEEEAAAKKKKEDKEKLPA